MCLFYSTTVFSTVIIILKPQAVRAGVDLKDQEVGLLCFIHGKLGPREGKWQKSLDSHATS